MTLRLRTLGSVYLSRNGEFLTGAASQRRLLAILTILATVGERGMSRDKLLGLLWSEGEAEKSRHALTQSLYHIRKALGAEQIFLTGTDLRLNPELLSSDIGDFQRALSEERLADAANAYGGAFLDGFYLNGDPPFEFWVSSERERLSRLYANAVQALAVAAQTAGDTAAELQWRTRLAEHDPLNGAAVAALMSCLIVGGDRAGALQRARAHESRMRSELELPADRAVAILVAGIRQGMSGSAPKLAIPTDDESQNPAGVTRDIGIPEVASPGERTDILPGAAMSRKRGDAARRGVLSWLAPTRRRNLWIGVVASLVGLIVVTQVAASRIASDHAAARQATIAVAPFRVERSNATAAYLREGLLELLAVRIADADRKRAADPTRVLNAWRAAGLDAGTPSSGAAARVGRALGAGEVVIGSLETTQSGVMIHASLIDAATARIKSTTDVRGSADSLMALTDRVISGLILSEDGYPLANLPQPPTVSPMALRAYLAGRVAYRRADYHGAVRAYNEALAQDPNFALAALSLAISADRVNAAEQHDRGLAVAWAKQSELSEGDRAFLHAFAGPRYPEPSSAAEELAAWERVVRIAPDRAEGWYELGEGFYYDGDLLGMSDALPRAAAAFRHALLLDPASVPARRMLTLLLARQGDTASLRQFVAANPISDTADAMNVFVRWRTAQALGDERALQEARRAFNGAPNAALRWIAMTAQFDGVSVMDGDRALAILGSRTLTDAELVDVALARHSRALNNGDYKTALAITTEMGAYQPALHPQLRLQILDALYAPGDRAAAVVAAADLTRATASPPAPTAADSAVRLADLCVLGQWRLSLLDTTGARAVIGPLRMSGAPRFPVPVAANPITCAELLDVSLAIAERQPAARDRLAHLDSLMLSGPAVGDAMRYANLVIARQYQRLGEPRLGLAALRRRSFMRGWPRYRATGLQLQMALALASGDTVSARSAKRRLLSTQH